VCTISSSSSSSSFSSEASWSSEIVVTLLNVEPTLAVDPLLADDPPPPLPTVFCCENGFDEGVLNLTCACKFINTRVRILMHENKSVKCINKIIKDYLKEVH
jgi:hypothetical protein